MENAMWLFVCIFSLVTMFGMIYRWFILRRAMLNNPTLLEQRQQVFSVTPYTATAQRHGLGFVQTNRCPVVIHSASSTVTYDHNGSGGYVNHTMVHSSTGRISGPPTYEQAVAIASAQVPKGTLPNSQMNVTEHSTVYSPNPSGNPTNSSSNSPPI